MRKTSYYSYLFLLPVGLIFSVFFLLPSFSALFFSLTRWTLSDWDFIGLDNFKMFLKEDSLQIGFTNTFIYAPMTCLLKVIFGLALGVYLSSEIRTKNFLRAVVFFPNLISMIAIGITFNRLMHPTKGLINMVLNFFHIAGPDWLGNPDIALFSIISVDVWQGVGVATIIFIAGISAIPVQYYEALMIDGGNRWDKFWHITLPLSRPAINTVIILALVGGLQKFDLVWSMTQGGPGFATDVVASVIYKQYQAGFYGLSTAGYVLMFLMVSLIIFPLFAFLNKNEVTL
jgi:raffinose/stachyose/melibiose transport system permease protein